MRLVGRQLGRFREAAGLTQRALADLVSQCEQTIASIEQGRRPLKPDLAERLDELLDTRGALAVAVENLPEVDLVPAWAEEYMDLEAEAIALSWYDNQVLPGLLQTEAYARAVFRNRVPVYGADEIEAQVAGRLGRQSILRREVPPTISFVVWEPVLMLRICEDEAYEEQLRHLRVCAELPGVSLQVLPLDSRTHAGLAGPFTLLETPDHQLVAYSEGHRGSQLVSDREEVSKLARKYAMLRSQALHPRDTPSLLDRLLGDR
ncbi:helix-turn-helix transcriptional regulator [Streptomyces sp. GC420]|uniref:helix-turn-helix domain-containing protein n=1 Tax=Streptomyces sp. GC420 TaxID=2697568 RepID=UPI001414CEF9|nr:helix-turn-helix transcriptional regulator [Streptomyces sp. GC420]NBM20456.1 helix-turn-helix domain-containing protein [Streptomyces sp. GC420]